MTTTLDRPSQTLLALILVVRLGTNPSNTLNRCETAPAMMFPKLVTAFLLSLCVPGIFGFALNRQAAPRSMSTSVRMSEQHDGMNKVAASFVAAAFILGSTMGPAPAFAMDDVDFGSTQVIAGRSGGRAGGRSAARPSPSRAPAPSRSTTVINRTYVTPSPMYSTPYYSPGIVVAPPLYNPLPGIGEYPNRSGMIGKCVYFTSSCQMLTKEVVHLAFQDLELG